MVFRIKFTLLFYLLVQMVSAQIGGNSTYKFLNMTNSARSASLGGNVITINDYDLNFAYHNPALLNENMSNCLALNYIGYFADIKYGYAAYARGFKKAGNFSIGIYHINYGEFTRADAKGNITGTFGAAEYSTNISWSKPIDSLFTFGITVKPIYSHLENYKSYGIATDIGILYFNPKTQLSAAIVARNMGTQIQPYYTDHYEPIPFEIHAGISKRLTHAPFRFTILFHNLEQLDLTYDDPNEKQSSVIFEDNVYEGNKVEEKFDKVFRHINLGIEFMPFKNFFFNFGYNHQRRKELQIEDRTGFVGLSWGFGIKLSKFHISYGRASYHLAGASNHFSVTTNFSEFMRKAN